MMRKKIVSLCMALALCLGLLPVTALAATVENITYLDENGTQQTAANATQVTNSDTEWTDGWYVAQSNITIDGTVAISGNVHLILEDGCNLTVNGGILLTKGSNMYIYAQSTEKVSDRQRHGCWYQRSKLRDADFDNRRRQDISERQRCGNLCRFPYYYGWLCKCLGNRLSWYKYFCYDRYYFRRICGSLWGLYWNSFHWYRRSCSDFFHW